MLFCSSGLAENCSQSASSKMSYLVDAMTQVAVLVGLAGLPWVVKPLYGFISDSIPLFGYRRRSYLMLCGLAGQPSFVACCFLFIYCLNNCYPYGMPTSSALRLQTCCVEGYTSSAIAYAREQHCMPHCERNYV